MAPRVQILPDHVANQIAAGEVVERPASVVKELVENALDAGATRVRIEVEDGGKRLIRIVDDGCGMAPEDALLSLRRHATSKVCSVEDLKTIHTLGFRGEALPSIRSVARFSLRTRLHDAAEGVRISADGAAEPEVAPAGGPPGTEIVVSDLFFNVPARRKFLRTTGTEMSRIKTLVNRFALGFPGVAFELRHNGRKACSYPSDTAPEARILAVLGREVCRRLYPARLELGEHSVSGFISEPGLSQGSPKGIFTYINGRFVRDRVLQHAVTQAYSGILDRGRYPLVVLFLIIPPASVDVNVHPSKAEVRFVESGSIHGLVERAIRLTLSDTPWTREQTNYRPRPAEAESPQNLPLFDPVRPPAPLDLLPSGPATVGPVDDPLPDFGPPTAPTATPPASDPAPDALGPGDLAPGPFTRMMPAGVVADRWLIAETASALVLIDLRRSRRALLAARLSAQLDAGVAQSQRLLFPLQFELDATRHRAATEHGALLVRLGFELEPFGGRDWVISAQPAILTGCDPAAALDDLLACVAAERGALEPAVIALVAFAAEEGSAAPDNAFELLKALDAAAVQPAEVSVSHSFSDVTRWFGS